MNVTIGGIARTVEITSFDKLGDVKVCMLTTTADGSVGFQQLNQEVIDTIYASFPVDTAKGSIASFEDGADNVPVRELKLNLEPYQNLNGYDHPWVGGAGNNQTYFLRNGYYNESGAIVSGSANGITAPVFVANGKSIVFSASASGSGRGIAVFSDSALTTLIYRSTSYTATTPRPYILYTATQDCYVSFWYNYNNSETQSADTFKTHEVKAEFGTTPASDWSPYSNICPIYPANGKNLFSGTLVNGQIGSNGGYSSSTSRLTNVTASNVLGDFLKAGTYTISAQAVTFATSLTQCTVLTKDSSLNIIDNFAASWHDLPFTFTLSSDGYICFTLRPSTGNVTPSNYVAQVEHGSIATTYVPYNAIGITRTGANLWDEEWELGAISGTTGQNSGSSTSIRCKNYIPVAPSTTYYMYVGTNVNNAPFFYDANKNFISRGSYIQSGTFTTPNNCYYMRIALPASYGSTYNNDISINYPSSVQTYEPYQGERYYPISDNPVYGGTLDVTTGLLTVTKNLAVFNGVGYSFYYTEEANNGRISWGEYQSIGKVGGKAFLSDKLKMADTYTSEPDVWEVSNSGVSVARCFIGVPDTITSVDDWRAYCETNPIQLVYELATPVQYQLTPTQVKTLLGYNNIWTDSGTVEVQYLANIGLYIQKIIGATEDDMVANQNISANKYFFVGEELYYSTSAISAGQTIVVGTNCIKTNLADALNALNS